MPEVLEHLVFCLGLLGDNSTLEDQYQRMSALLPDAWGSKVSYPPLSVSLSMIASVYMHMRCLLWESNFAILFSPVML